MPLPSHSNVERAGWFTQHPVREEPVHVVTREWFDEIKAERDDLREEVELAAEQGRLVGLEAERYRQALESAQGEAYLGALEGDDTPDPLAACWNVIKVCQEALDA